MSVASIDPVDFSNTKPGDIVRRIWGLGFMENTMRVSAVDEQFVYCNAQGDKNGKLLALPDGATPWKFDRAYGVETDEEQGWGIAYGLVMTRIVP